MNSHMKLYSSRISFFGNVLPMRVDKNFTTIFENLSNCEILKRRSNGTNMILNSSGTWVWRRTSQSTCFIAAGELCQFSEKWFPHMIKKKNKKQNGRALFFLVWVMRSSVTSCESANRVLSKWQVLNEHVFSLPLPLIRSQIFLSDQRWSVIFLSPYFLF